MIPCLGLLRIQQAKITRAATWEHRAFYESQIQDSLFHGIIEIHEIGNANTLFLY